MDIQVTPETTVTVLLTKTGKQQFKDFFGLLQDQMQQPEEAFPSLNDHEVTDGVYEMPLWQFVSVFGGSRIFNGEMLQQDFEEKLRLRT